MKTMQVTLNPWEAVKRSDQLLEVVATKLQTFIYMNPPPKDLVESAYTELYQAIAYQADALKVVSDSADAEELKQQLIKLEHVVRKVREKLDAYE